MITNRKWAEAVSGSKMFPPSAGFSKQKAPCSGTFYFGADEGNYTNLLRKFAVLRAARLCSDQNGPPDRSALSGSIPSIRRFPKAKGPCSGTFCFGADEGNRTLDRSLGIF